MRKKILILILVFSVFVVGLCFGVNTYAWDESDDYQGSPIANGSEFMNCSITFPPESYSGEYWYSNTSGYLFYLNNVDLPYNYCIQSYTVYEQDDTEHNYFGFYVQFSNEDFEPPYYCPILNVYYYNSSNVKINVNSQLSKYVIDDVVMYFYHYPIIDMIDYTGLNVSEPITYYIEYTGSCYSIDTSTDTLVGSYDYSLYVYNMSNRGTNYVYQGNEMLYLSSFNYFGPMGTQISDVLSDTFSLGTGILGAIASYFNVFALTDGNLSWIAVFGFALLGISLCIGMTRWISSLIRRKI